MNLIIKNYEEELYYPVKCDSVANINNALDIWMKFSNHLTTDELLFMDGLKNKELNAFSQTELDKYHRIKKQLDFSKLLLKYKNKSCTREEHNFVSQFMNTSLKEFVKSKVTKEQQESAERIINLIQRKKLLINLKVLIEKTLAKMNSEVARILVLKFFDKLKPEICMQVLNVTRRTYFRRVNSAIDEFGEMLENFGYTENVLSKMLDKENWIKEYYNNYKQQAQKKYENEKNDEFENVEFNMAKCTVF